MNGGQIIVQSLLNQGTQHLFTLCGGHIGPIYVEAEKAGIRVWDVRDEATSVFAADAVARITGMLGVAAVTAGPGVTNAITALKNAQMAQSPLLVLGGAAATMLRGRGALQDIDQISLLRSTVKYFGQVRRICQLVPKLRQAWDTAFHGVPGPVFLECPVDVLYPEALVREWYSRKSKGPVSLLESITQAYIRFHVNRLFAGSDRPLAEMGYTEDFRIDQPSHRSLRAVSQALQQANRPVLLLGSGSMLSPTMAAELSESVIKMGIPVYLSGMARGLAGRHNTVQYCHHRKEALREADLIILAGVPCDFRLDYGRTLSRRAKKIAINRNPSELHKNLRADRTVHTDPGQFLIALARQLPTLPHWSEWKKTLQGREDAREAEIAQIAAYTLHPRKPLSWLDPGVFGTLGVGGGFALGAAACCPDDYIWIIYGDGSAAYSLAEFETFAKNGLKVCGIVGNNGSWEQIARDQVELLGGDTAVTLPRSDYHRVAEGYGAAGERVDTIEGFEQAVCHALSSMDRGVPYLINAIIGSTPFRKGSLSM